MHDHPDHPSTTTSSDLDSITPTATAVPAVYDAWTLRFSDHRPRQLLLDGHPVAARAAHLGPVRGLGRTGVRLRLSEDGTQLTVERTHPGDAVKDVTAAANALRRTAWALDQGLPQAPALFLDALRTHRLRLEAIGETAAPEPAAPALVRAPASKPFAGFPTERRPGRAPASPATTSASYPPDRRQVSLPDTVVVPSWSSPSR